MMKQLFSGVVASGRIPFFARRCALAVVALGVALVWQNVSQGSCGDYVLMRDASGRLVRASELSGGSPTEQHGAASLPHSCRGPACSGRPLTPSAPPPAPPSFRLVPEAIAAAAAGDEHSSGLARRHPQSEPLHPIHHPGRIFRPPR